MQLTSGDRLGPYTITTALGAGGMGEVYRARDGRLERDVAIKVLGGAFAADADRVRRFTIEAQATGALNHPNILAVYDIGTHEDTPYLVTELLEGETLRARMDAERVPLSKALDLARQVASGLAAAHAKGITHRDIKPENLFVTTDGRVKILDFGLAKQRGAKGDESTVLQSPTSAGMVLGTVGYMSPEQVCGETADARSDIFSFGVVLYELLSGQRPFIGDTAVQTMNAILTEDPPEIVTTGKPLPPALERVVRHCLEKKADERFQSARDLAFALDALSSGSGTSTSSAPTIAVGPTRLARHWLPVALVGLGLAAGLALSAMLTGAGANHGAVRYSRFATEADAEYTPAWSPDGRTIAYSRVTDGLVQIFVRSLDSDNARQLTRDGGYQPFWWPNSDRIGYLGPGGIWTVSAVGGQPTLLQEGSFHNATVSPDGTLAAWRVVTGDGTTTATVVVASPADGDFQEYAPAPFRLTENMTTNFVAFSPDGSELLLAAFDPNAVRRLWRLPMPIGRGAPIEVPTSLRSPGFIAWLPDNRRFVATAAPDGSAESQLWLVDARTGGTTPLTSGLVTLSSPAVWGERLVVTAGQPDYDIVELPLSGAPVRDVFATGTSEQAGVWIPGTRRLIYSTARTGRGEIRMRDLSSGVDRLVVAAPPGFSIGGATPSPDGRNIAYHRVVPGSSVWITPIEGGTPQRISKDDGAEIGATWSPDSNRIAVYRAQAVRITNVGSGAVERDLPLSREGFGEPEWSPTGEWIAAPLARGIALLDPAGATTRPDLVTDRRVSTVAWSADGRTLYAVDSLIGETRLLAVTVDTGVVREVTRFVGVNVGTGGAPNLRLSFNVEGTALLTTSFRTNTDLWILDNVLPPPSDWRRWFGLR